VPNPRDFADIRASIDIRCNTAAPGWSCSEFAMPASLRRQKKKRRAISSRMAFACGRYPPAPAPQRPRRPPLQPRNISRSILSARLTLPPVLDDIVCRRRQDRRPSVELSFWLHVQPEVKIAGDAQNGTDPDLPSLPRRITMKTSVFARRNDLASGGERRATISPGPIGRPPAHKPVDPPSQHWNPAVAASGKR